MLLITGLGRTGTSLLASFCKQMGRDPLGKWIESKNAGYEDQELIEINQALYSGDEDFDLNRIKNYDRTVAKDPRLFLFSDKDVISQWCKHRKDARFLVAHRSFENIANSRNNIDDEEYASKDKLKVLFANAVSQLVLNNAKFKFLKFPDFVDNYDLVFQSLSKFGGLNLNYEEGKVKWNELVDKSQIHFT